MKPSDDESLLSLARAVAQASTEADWIAGQFEYQPGFYERRLPVGAMLPDLNPLLEIYHLRAEVVGDRVMIQQWPPLREGARGIFSLGACLFIAVIGMFILAVIALLLFVK